MLSNITLVPGRHLGHAIVAVGCAVPGDRLQTLTASRVGEVRISNSDAFLKRTRHEGLDKRSRHPESQAPVPSESGSWDVAVQSGRISRRAGSVCFAARWDSSPASLS